MPSKVEAIKGASDGLRGHLRQELADPAPGVSEEGYQLLKFHGIYQQEDRDGRRLRKAQGLPPDRMFMVRAAIPGGALSAEQYLALDTAACRLGLDGLRITTRQNIQFHQVVKMDLEVLIRHLSDALVTTLSGCGDVVRNVVACPLPFGAGRPELTRIAQELSRLLKPRTGAYAELWLGAERVWSAGPEEPFYGPTYLPRKFKIGLAVAGDNCTDVYSQDVGLVAHPEGEGAIAGFTVLVGGGLGRTHGMATTRPFLGQPLGWVGRDQVAEVVLAVVATQRDHGNREDRKRARLKYLVAERGVDWLKREVEARSGVRLAPAPSLAWRPLADHLGWIPGPGGVGGLGVRVPCGRLVDRPGTPLRSTVRRVVARFGPSVHLTAMQNLLLVGLTEPEARQAEGMLEEGGFVPLASLGPVGRHAMACPALPTCGLALAEAERVFAPLVATLEARWREVAGPVDLHLRMTGCPNGCARPYLAEVGVVGRTLGKYAVYLGGSPEGDRLAELWADAVPLDRIPACLEPVWAAYARDAAPGERLGDFCRRVGLERLKDVSASVGA